MPVDANGRWSPGLFPRQQETMAACMPGQKQNIILLSGPRKSSKTRVCLNVVPQHAWHVPGANICILTITQSAGTDSGPWQLLTEQTLPEWISGDFGLEWEKPPYTEGVTKKPKCKLRTENGIATCSLESLKNEDEVEDRFKGKEYSMIWVNELSKFHNRRTLDTLLQCLRGFPKKNLLFLADTNPCLEEGINSWIYQLWYVARTADDEMLQRLYPDIGPDKLKPMMRRLRLIEFTVDDNLSMTQEDKDELLGTLAHDQDLVQAYYYGKWITASTDALFYRVFRPSFHVIGEAETPGNPDPEILVPQENCSELYTGWDPGDSRNSAATIAEKVYRAEPVTDKEGRPVIDPQTKQPKQKLVSIFKFLDELVIVGEDHRLEDFVLEFMEKMVFWEEVLGRVGKTIWHHWSDRSVFERLTPETNRYLHQVIYEASVSAIASGDFAISAPILLEGADRSPGSVVMRVDLWRRLHFENRIFYSKAKCPRLIESTRGLRKGTSIVQPVARNSPLKHAWDSGSYLVTSECSDELNRITLNHLVRTSRKSEAKIVSVRM